MTAYLADSPVADPSIFRSGAYVGGAWNEVGDSGRISVENPSTGPEIAELLLSAESRFRPRSPPQIARYPSGQHAQPSSSHIWLARSEASSNSASDGTARSMNR